METAHSTLIVSEADRKQLRELLHMNIDSRDGFAYAGERLAEKHSSLSNRFIAIHNSGMIFVKS